MRANRPTSSASASPTWCSQATGSGARNAGEPPGATTTGWRPARRAATAAAKRPSAMPTPTSVVASRANGGDDLLGERSSPPK